MAKGRKTGDITDIIADVLFYIIGLGALIGGALILWWGEDQTARYTALSDFAEKSLVELDASRVDPALEGKLGHVTGMAESASTLSDQRLGINEKGFYLKRKVEYYQLVEHKKKVEDKDKAKKHPPEYSYRYQKKWVEKAVPFKAFHDPYFRNKGRAPIANIKGGHVVSNRVTLGAYRLPRFLAKAVRGEVPVKISLSEEQRSALIESMELKDPSLLKEWGEGLYIGESPDRPELGDVRIREYVVPLTTVSVLAKIKGDSFEPFRQDESKLNVNIGKIVSGSASAAEMLGDLKSDVGWGAWLVRAVGLPIMLFGLLF
ncbi:MAG: hypothetical protein IKX79_01920, partial [Desulfovibrionaceae bacterium]|nr:hypothetical protein [Desulfovibrionaceae bacterium]